MYNFLTYILNAIFQSFYGHIFLDKGQDVRIHDLIKRLSDSQALSNLIGLRSKEGYENLLEITSISSHKKPK